MLMEFLFEQDEMVDIYTEDEDYQFDTITNPRPSDRRTAKNGFKLLYAL